MTTFIIITIILMAPSLIIAICYTDSLKTGIKNFIVVIIVDMILALPATIVISIIQAAFGVSTISGLLALWFLS